MAIFVKQLLLANNITDEKRYEIESYLNVYFGIFYLIKKEYVGCSERNASYLFSPRKNTTYTGITITPFDRAIFQLQIKIFKSFHNSNDDVARKRLYT